MTPGSEWKRTVEVKAGVPEKRTTNESKKKKKKVAGLHPYDKVCESHWTIISR